MQSLYIYDGTGNPAALITSGPNTALAYAYDPYGLPTLTEDSGGLGTSQNPYTFKQGIQDRTTGWIKYGARWYNPIDGRWTQQDTLDAPLDPLNANRYAYAANDPINNSDPLGLFSLGDAVGAVIGIGAAAGGIALGCAATAGVVCALGVAVGFGAAFGAVGGLTGGAIGAKIDGGSSEDINQAALTGFARGALSGATSAARGVYLDRIASLAR